MKFTLKRPCDECPFRREPFFYLEPERIEEIATTDSVFPCHKTTITDNDTDEETTPLNAQACKGWLIVHEKQKTSSNALRIAYRLRLLTPRATPRAIRDDVYTSFDEYKNLSENESLTE